MLNPTFAKPPVAEKSTVSVPPTNARLWTLDDGLTVIVQEDHSAPVASVQAWCDTGSIDEVHHMGAGLSHILEHMLFKGTETRTSDEISQKIQDYGGYVNAYTSYDRTVFHIDVPAKGVETVVDILCDTMMNSTLPPEEYTKEQEVIRREFAMGYDDPDRMASELLFQTAYQVHPCRNPVIGYIDIYNSLTRDDVMAYYKARYVPNNLTFVVTGDVDGEKVHAQLAKFFAKYPRKAMEPVVLPVEPPQLGKREQHKEFRTELTRLEMAWHIPEVTHPDVPALDLLSNIMGSGRSSRLYKTIREERALVHGISAYSYTPAYPGLFGISAVLDPDKREETQKQVLQMINDVATHGVTQAEIDKARKQFVSGHLAQLATTNGRAGDLGSSWLMTRNLDFSRQYLDALQHVTTSDIQRVAQKYLVDANLTITSLNPPGSLKNSEKPVAEVKAGDIQKFDLPNGIRLLVREDARLPLISTLAVFKGGLLAETPEDNGISQLVSKVIVKGTKTRSAEQIAGQIESLGGSIGADAGNSSISVGVGVTKPDLQAGLELLADVILNPTMPDAAIEREKQAQLAAIKEEDEQPTVLARNALRAAMFGGHPYALRNSGTPETVTKLNRTNLLAYHAANFVGQNCVIAVYGDVKAAEVKAAVEKLFAKMPAGRPGFVDLQKPAPLAKSAEVGAQKPGAQAVIMEGFPGVDVFNPDREALELVNEACSDLGSRFFIRIRQQMGLAYYVSSAQMLGLSPGMFVFYLGTSPEKAVDVRKAFDEEINKLAADGITAQELARAKEKLLGQDEIERQSNDALAKITALDELYGLGFDHYKTVRPKVEAVTLEDAKRVCQKYFRDQQRIVSTVCPPEGQTTGPKPAK
jgi:zinc protease